MSPSIMATRAPLWLSAMARFTATVDLPTPPLPAPTAMTFFTPSTGALLISGEIAALTLAVIWTCTEVTPGIRATTSCARPRIVSFVEDIGVASSIVKATRPPSICTLRTNFRSTMLRLKSGSSTAVSAWSTAASVTVFMNRSIVLGAGGWGAGGWGLGAAAWLVLSLIRDLAREGHLESMPLVGLEHQQQPEDGRQWWDHHEGD